MSNLKCPFCNKPLQPTLRQSDEYWCENYDCPGTNIEWVGSQKLWQELIRTRKALDYCIERFKSLENVLDEKAEASDIPDNPDLYAWAVRIKPIWSELKEITGIDYTKGGDNE